jgi:hypothetical protein
MKDDFLLKSLAAAFVDRVHREEARRREREHDGVSIPDFVLARMARMARMRRRRGISGQKGTTA